MTHASANLLGILGHPAEAVLGRPLQQAIGDAACSALRGAQPGDGATIRPMHTMPGPSPETLDLRSHRSGRHLCIDIVPIRPEPGPISPYSLLQSLLETFKQATTRQQLCDLAVRGLHAISGFDRVMAYRFAADGHGEVIAEVRAAHLESYLGLHYPAADLPPQARKLFLRNRVAATADYGYEPVALLIDPEHDDGTPLDLTLSSLRSVSPFHREYMRNMKTAASLTVAITHGADPGERKLWGMLVCHHQTPRMAGADLRAVVAMIGQAVSLLVNSLSETETYALRLRRYATLRTLVERMAAPAPVPDTLAEAEAELLRLLDAAGAVVRWSGKLLYFGHTPPPPAVEQALATLFGQSAGAIVAVNDLGLRHPELKACTSAGSGALLLPLARDSDNAILWFRPELSQIVAWGGNPAEHVIFDSTTGRLSPRASFAVWQETVRGYSEPWTAADLALACDIRTCIETAAAEHARAELIRLRYYDTLTGLPNRSLLQDRLTQAEHEPGTNAALLFIDLDCTKTINDAMGYAAGDALLVEVGRRLRVIAGAEHFPARLGGDEFALLCRGLDRNAAAEFGEQVRQAIQAPFEIAGQSCNISASVGITVVDQSGGLNRGRAGNMAMYSATSTIGARQNAEDQRQKMEVLGRMMGGVAHEINNMLQPVTLLAQDLIDSGLVAEDGRLHLETVVDCTRKAREIIGDVLAFSRPTPRDVEIHDPVVLLQDSLRLVRQAIPSSLTLTVQVEGQPPHVAINTTSFVQILLNLATNAAAAMDGQGEFTILLDANAPGPNEPTAKPQAGFARLQVIDTGCGMDKTTMDRAFEPFFTTKPVGQGTGLGLPAVYGMVRQMGGTISLDSRPGRGTTVTILIPGQHGKSKNGDDIVN